MFKLSFPKDYNDFIEMKAIMGLVLLVISFQMVFSMLPVMHIAKLDQTLLFKARVWLYQTILLDTKFANDTKAFTPALNPRINRIESSQGGPLLDAGFSMFALEP